MCEKNLAQQILQDIDILNTQGLDRINPVKNNELIQQYNCGNSPYAEEIIAWLRGEYTFDPACLTG
ncbi:hypothetical protein H206_00726 [Candidatus Electrothrix aarhusensis]|uniref:Uncharacterized protein n=1 Tax=Candidatus Electrothrix aarhusensis TaxID=1859131 RepID=A0A3S3R729_9BACT|nr:hypothetical protein H206_00726 [Candidatus Electrothrix aarhusensis]